MAAQGATRGAFILFEGVDRSGKSTQARQLVEALKLKGVSVIRHTRFRLAPLASCYGRNCIASLQPNPQASVKPQTVCLPLQIDAQLWNFPDRSNTITGSIINDYLAGSKDMNDRAVHLLFSANRHEKRYACLPCCCVHWSH
jgi:dTMP kinase